MNSAIAWLIPLVILAFAGLVLVWRKKIGGRPVPDVLKPGQALPEFSAVDEDGNRLSSVDLRGSPSIILFVRGTWCPFCSRQVADLTKAYKEITDVGAKLILITPKPLETTRRVADMFGVQFDFWLDESLAIAEQLGLLLESAVPEEQRDAYGDDTLWPTSLVVDSNGIIRFSELSRFLVDRPNPQKLLNVVRNL